AQLTGGVEERTPAEVPTPHEIPQHGEEPEQAGPPIGRRDAFLDTSPPLPGLALEVPRDQIVLRAEVGVERRLRRPRPGQDPLDAGGPDAFRVEELAGRVE